MMKSCFFLLIFIISLSADEFEKTKRPIAVILTCSDSKLSIDNIFKKKFKDVFIVRNFGNIVDESVIASIEFYVKNLGAVYVIVMGHQGCKAVEGALDVTFLNKKPKPESLNNIFKYIQPSFKNIETSDEVNQAVKDNAYYQKNQLIFKSPLIQTQIRKNKLQCLAFYYDIMIQSLSEIKN